MNSLRKSGIYRITNIINGKGYVGSAVNLEKRFHQHRSMLKNGIHHSVYLQRVWNKYGNENFRFDILVCCPANILLELEQLFLIAGYGHYNINPNAHSRLGAKFTDEQRLRLSQAHLGYVHTPEQNAKLGVVSKARWLDPEYRKKIIDKMKERWHNPEYRAIFTARKGKANPFYGKKHSKATRIKMSESAKRRPSNRKGQKLSRQTRQRMSETKKSYWERKRANTII